MILKTINIHNLQDKNSLYGWSMSEYLSYKKFEWLENIDEFDVMSINEKKVI